MLPIYLAMINSEKDKSKFEQLYNLYKQSMFFAAKNILKDDYLAEDAVHQAFIRLIENLGRIQEVDCPKTHGFAVTIVHNISIDIYRKRKRQAAIPYDEISYLAADQDTISNLGELSPLAAAIAKLPVEAASIIRLRFSQGYDIRDIAKILHLTEDTVYKRIQRAKKKLENLLEEQGVSI